MLTEAWAELSPQKFFSIVGYTNNVSQDPGLQKINLGPKGWDH